MISCLNLLYLSISVVEVNQIKIKMNFRFQNIISSLCDIAIINLERKNVPFASIKVSENFPNTKCK